MQIPSVRNQYPPLQHIDFSKLFISNIITNVGFWFTTVALYSIFVFETDVGPLVIGGLTIASIIPRALGSPVLGVLADRYSRRNLIVGAELASAAVILVLFLYRSLLLAYITYFLLSLFTAIADPAHESIIPQIMTDDEVGQANGLMSSSESVAQILGPAIAGALLTVISAEILLLIDVISYILSAGIIATIAVYRVANEANTLFGDVKTGIQTFIDSRSLLLIGTTGIALFAALAPFEALIMLYIREIIASGASVYGVAVSMTAGGSLLAGVIISKYGNVINEPTTIAGALILDGTAMLGHVVLPSIPTLYIMSFFMGLATTTVMVLLITMIQKTCDEGVVGRILGIFNGITESSQLTFILVASVATNYLGILTVFTGAGALLLLFGIVFGSTRFVEHLTSTTAEG